MSQRECAGFNWPPFSVSAKEPIRSSPKTVSRAGPVRLGLHGSNALRIDPLNCPWLASESGTVIGVGHAANCANPPISNSPLRLPPRDV